MVSKPADDGSTIYTQTTQSEQDLLSIQNKRSTFINPTKKTTESLPFTSQCDQQISTSHSQGGNVIIVNKSVYSIYIFLSFYETDFTICISYFSF